MLSFQIMSLITGIVAHVDAGKTTLSEAILYKMGVIRKLGRVDDRNTFLDTDVIERKRGITVFSKEAIATSKITLLDTPGHIDLTAEMERTLSVLDAAILVLSAPDGIQAHTRTLWPMLERANIPTLIFVNKIDMFKGEKNQLLTSLYKGLSDNIVDFSNIEKPSFIENISEKDDALTEKYLDNKEITIGDIKRVIKERKVFPLLFGSALKLNEIDNLINILTTYFEPKPYSESFSGIVYRVSRDKLGARLTHLKVTGGVLHAKDMLGGEKANELRVSSGEKAETVKEVKAGELVQIVGLKDSKPGMSYGSSMQYVPTAIPALSYQVIASDQTDISKLYRALSELQEELPELSLGINRDEIRISLMGEIQKEIITDIIKRRYGIAIDLKDGKIKYKETIENSSHGIGHFEPLKHYAEVHLKLSPAPRGSGLSFKSLVPTDLLELNWQRLILTHLKEKEHLGILTGSPITDIEITLIAGRAHLKHTEGGDFREATYRAVRNGLMKARSILLEPIYSFIAIIPESSVGRFLSDITMMSGNATIKDSKDGFITLEGKCPVSTMLNYAITLRSYTKGEGTLTTVVSQYDRCHNEDEIINSISYDPLSDLENTPSSVFCSHGAGFPVPWDRIEEYAHIKL